MAIGNFLSDLYNRLLANARKSAANSKKNQSNKSQSKKPSSNSSTQNKGSANKSTPSSNVDVNKLAQEGVGAVLDAVEKTPAALAPAFKNNTNKTTTKPVPVTKAYSYIQQPTPVSTKKSSQGSLFKYSSLHNVPSVKGRTVGKALEIEESILQANRTTDEPRLMEEKMKIFSNNLLYKISESERESWIAENTMTVRRFNPETGKVEPMQILKANAKAPQSLSKEEREIWEDVMQYTWELDADKTKVAQTASSKADFTDYSMKTNNSYADIVRTFIYDASEKGFHAADINLKTNLTNYMHNYVLNPLRKGEFGVLANNTLVNLGETLDLAGVGVRAMIGSSKTVYGSGERLIEKQDYWVYSGGKKLQKKLIDLGAYDLVKYGEKNTTRGKNKHNADVILKRLEAEGLMDEYLKFKQEYYATDLSGDGFAALKEAYTSHKNYSADTGSTGKNILTELMTDPSLVLGGLAKGMASAGIESVTRGSAKAALKDLITDPKKYDEAIAITDKLAKRYFKDMEDNIFSAKTRDEAIQNNVRGIGELLENRGILPDHHARQIFEATYTKLVKEEIDKNSFRFIQGVKLLDRSIDVVDSTLLKSVLAAPYLGYLGTKSAYKLIRKTDTFKDIALKQARNRVVSGIQEVDGTVVITDIEKYLNRVGSEYLTDVSDEVFEETFVGFEKGAAKYDTELSQLRTDFNTGKYELHQAQEVLDNFIFQITKGDCTTADEFLDVLEKYQVSYLGRRDEIVKVCNTYITSLKRTINTIDKLSKNKIKEFYKQLRDVKDADDFLKIYEEAVIYRNILPSEFFASMDTLADNFDTDTLTELITSYELRNNTTLKDAPSVVGDFEDIVTPYSDSDLLMKGEISSKLQDAFKLVQSEIQNIPDGITVYRKMNQYINRLLTDAKHTDLREFLDRYRELDGIYTARVMDAKTIVTDAESNYRKQLLYLTNQIIEEELSTAVKRDSQLVQMHVDKLAVLDKYLAESNLKSDIFMMLSHNSEIGSLLNNIASLSEEGMKNLNELTGIKDFAQICKTLVEEVETARAVFELREDLIPLTDRERWAVLEALFGVSKGAPEDYARMSLDQREEFIKKVELWMSSNYGDSKVSLDGFTLQALDFESDLYKHYANEVQDLHIQERVRKFLEGGHIDPIKDVQKQMFQLILKDPDSVKHYNTLCHKQDVIFTDIETQGLNSAYHEITSVGMKKWVEIPEGATLKEILDILEDASSENTITAYRSEAWIRENISDEILELMFKNDVVVPESREYRLSKYIEKYGAEVNGKEFSEDDLLNELMKTFDESYAAWGNTVPTVVVHNNNGFDMNFIRDRSMAKNIYTDRIDHLSTLLSASENTLMRLKGLEDDIVLSKESKELIINSIEECMSKIRHKRNMRLFSPENIEDGLLRLYTGIRNNVDKWEDNLTLNTLKAYYEQGKFAANYENFRNTSKELLQKMHVFKNNIVVNPYRINLANLGSDELKLYFSQDELDIIAKAIKDSDVFTYRMYNEQLLKKYLAKNYAGYDKQDIDNYMRMIRTMNDSDIPPLGYRILFDDVEVSKFFTITENIKYSEEQLRDMQEFSKAVANTVNKRLKANSFIEGRIDDYKAIIEAVKDYASQLNTVDKFSFLKYIETPSTVAEAYVVAQKLWDMIDNELFKDLISQDTAAILSDIGSNYHHKIYKDVVKDYFTKYSVDIFNDTLALKSFLDDCREGKEVYAHVSTLLEESSHATLKDVTFMQAYSRFVEFIEYFKNLADEETKIGPDSFMEVALKDLADEMNARRNAMSSQIMEYITKSEENLIQHLMFHNQFLNIPVKGTRQHMRQVNQLLKQLAKYSPEKINWIQKNGFVHISLSKGNVLEIIDDAVADKPTRMKFKGESKEYTAPKYQRIQLDIKPGKYRSFDYDSKFTEMYKELDEQLYRLTNGASSGSVGALHTFSKQKEMYRLLDSKFLRNAMTENYTCHARLWHGASFDMTNLGDLENCWKYGKGNDIDPLIIMKEQFDELRGRVQSERVVLDTWFNPQSEFNINNLFSYEVDNKYIMQTMRNMSDHTCVILTEGKTESGYIVQELDIVDETALEVAKESNAIFIPYDMYLEMEAMINQSKINNTALKIATKYIHYLKCGQIMFPGTWIRNWMDATIKTIGDTGSVTDTVRYQLVAINLINDYHKVIKHFEKTRNLSYKSMNMIRREFDSISGISITYEQFEFLEAWFNNSVSGGESALVKAILANSKGTTNAGLKQGLSGTRLDRRNALQQFDAITSDIEAFQSLPYDEIVSLCGDLKYNDFVKFNMSKDRFLEGFKDVNVLTDKEFIQWNQLANYMIQKRSKRMASTSILDEGIATLDNLVSKALMPMSRVEEVVRLGEYLALENQGYKKGEIFKKITETHFNYDNKTMREKVIELFIPFYTFEKANLMYWARQISENPRMLRYLEHFWSELSWENSNVSEEEYSTNYALQNVLRSGNIPLGNSGLYFKANPSFMTALGYITGGPNEYLNKLSIPLQILAKVGMRELGADSRALFSEVNLEDYEFNLNQALNLIPVAGVVWDKFDKAFDIGNIDPVYLRLTQEAQEGWQGYLVRAFPSIFGAVNLQGGFTSEKLSWEEIQQKMLLQGKAYDANVGKFVPLHLITIGGLNREFDFSKPGEWEEYCRLMKLYHGKIWDANQSAFVLPEDYIPGMLNDPDLTWDEVCYYNFKLFGKVWDANQGRFIKIIEKYISGGLNSNDLTWDELSALQYAIHGKVWDYDSHSWVQVTEPNVVYTFGQAPQVQDTIVREDRESILSKLGIVSPVYADTLVQNAMDKTKAPFKDEKGRYVLTGNAEHDAKVFDLIKSEAIIPSERRKYQNYSKDTYMKYKNGNAAGFKYKATSMLPTKTYRNARVYYNGIRSGKKVYGKPYSAGKNLAGLRMATSNYTAYDVYYDYEYSYSYKYRNTIKAVADYPQTKLGIQRYMRLRGESLLKNFQNRNNYDIGNTHSLSGLSTEQRLNKIKMHWWNR